MCGCATFLYIPAYQGHTLDMIFKVLHSCARVRYSLATQCDCTVNPISHVSANFKFFQKPLGRSASQDAHDSARLCPQHLILSKYYFHLTEWSCCPCGKHLKRSVGGCAVMLVANLFKPCLCFALDISVFHVRRPCSTALTTRLSNFALIAGTSSKIELKRSLP